MPKRFVMYPAAAHAGMFCAACLFSLFTIFCSPPLHGQIPPLISAGDTVLHAHSVEVIRFHSGHFSVVGNLYLPASGRRKVPLVIWVSGSGPSYRTVNSSNSIRLVNCFLERGFACFRCDKPGYGESTGTVEDDSTFAQLSDVVVDAVKILKNYPGIAARRIGLFGSSQAGYIMPLAISKCPDIAFMIGSSCPGENSIEQWAYLITCQMVCEGISPETAVRNAAMFTTVRCTTDKEKFDEGIEYFDRHPMIIRSVGYDSTFSRMARAWWPRHIDSTDESHFDPTVLAQRFTIPMFLAYGAQDKQIDPRQAMAAYQAAWRASGNARCWIVMLKDSDHNMSLSSGCLNEIASLNRSHGYQLDPEYLSVIAGWIAELRKMWQEGGIGWYDPE